jgi:hypothetical protein
MALALLVGLLPALVGAQTLSLTVGNVTRTCGGEVVVPATVSGAGTISSFGLDVAFLPQCLQFVRVEPGAATADWGLVGGNEVVMGVVRVGGTRFTGSPITGSGEILRLVFTCRPEACGCTSALIVSNLVDGLTGATLFNGSVVCSTENTREPNNSWQEAQLGEPIRAGETVTDLASLDEDWYRITFGPEESIRVRVLFSHAAGNVQAELYDIRSFDENAVPFRVGESYAPNHPWVWNPAAGDGPEPVWATRPWGPATADDEWITYVNTTGATELYLRVYGEGGATNPNYAIAVDSLGTDDSFEPNDSIAQAKTIVRDTAYEGLIGKNNDFYRVDVSEVSAIRVRLSCYALLGTMYFEVYGTRSEGGFGPIEAGKMYEPNRYEATRTVCVQGQDEVFVRVYPSVRMPNVYNLKVETLADCP